jgi:hypothetical protein
MRSTLILRILRSGLRVASVGLLMSAVAEATPVETARTIADLAVRKIDQH